MNVADPSTVLLAAAGGDTVKLFDVSAESGGGDPCILSYTPSPGSQLKTLKWNHTNLVVASAGEDKKISLWRNNGQSMGTIPVSGTENADNFEESVEALSFSSKSSRYLCTGGSGQVVRIWDLQRKRCIKRLRGHTDTITGAMYNCKDEHLASISLSGDLILHNLASGTRAAELKDPKSQVLKVLDYSRISRHLLVTAGDDGSVHLWDTTGRSPKISWFKQHSAPTAGVSFSPSNDKIIATVGLDKKLYTFDSGSRRPSFCITYEAPFSSLAFRDDGNILAAGTSSGRVVFYDVRGRPQPFTVLRAYGNSEAVTSLCWQRSKPVLVNENCTDETALLGGATEDSILMPDPLPSVTSSSASSYTAMAGSRNLGRSSLSLESSSSLTSSASMYNSLGSSTAEETPLRSSLWSGGNLARLQPTRAHNFKDDMDVFSPLVDVQPFTPPSVDKFWDEHGGARKDLLVDKKSSSMFSSHNFKDDMDVFSPLVDVQPITPPSADKLWDEHGGARKDLLVDKKSSSMFSSSRRFPLSQEGGNDVHPIFDWKSSSTSKQDDSQSFQQPSSTPAASSKTDDTSSITPAKAWGGERISDKLAHHRQSVNLPSRFATMASSSLSSTFSGSQDLALSTSPTSVSYLTSSSSTLTNLRHRDISESDTPLVVPEQVALSPTLSLSTRSLTGQSNLDTLGPTLNLPRRFSTYAERISTTPAFSDGTSLSISSPKTKKTGAETREELLNSFLSRSDAVPANEPGILSSANGGISQPQRMSSQPDLQQGSSFTLQLFQRSLEETLAPIQKAFHDATRNLHIEVLRQAHMQQMEYSGTLSVIVENQAEMMRRLQLMEIAVQQLRHYYSC